MMPGNATASWYRLSHPSARSAAADFSNPGCPLAFKCHLLKDEARRQSPALGHLLVSSHNAALKMSLRQEMEEESSPQQTKQSFTSLLSPVPNKLGQMKAEVRVSRISSSLK